MNRRSHSALLLSAALFGVLQASCSSHEAPPRAGTPEAAEPEAMSVRDGGPAKPRERDAATNASKGMRDDPPSEGDAPKVATAKSPSLQWKRYVAFEADLAAALALPKEELCKEFGTDGCIRDVHLSPLGGHDPFETGLLEPSAEPLATTPTVVERIVLSACTKRAELDRAGKSEAAVFRAFGLEGPAPDSKDATVGELVTALYRRFLARNPDPAETAVVAALVRDEAGKPVSALDFAKSACFAIGTTSEFLFF